MKPGEDLFDLIQSMTAAERRHFKLNAKRYSPSGYEKKYVLMFDAIAKQDQYDEVAIRAMLAMEIHEKSFSSWKRHLLGYLETAIREFHAGKDRSALVQEKLRDADLMFRRGLWARAQKKITESRDIAERLGDLIALLKINETERRFVIQFEKKGITQKMEALLEEAKSILLKIQQEQSFADIFDRICLLVRLKFDPRHPQVVEKVPVLMRDQYLQPQSEFPNFKSQRYYHQARAFLFHLANQPEQEFEEYLALRAHWENNPSFQKTYPKLYKLSLTNYLHAANKLSRWDHFPSVLEAISKMPPENRDEAAEEFQTVEFYRHLYLLDTHQLQPALNLIPQLEKGLLQFQPKVNHARWLAFRINITLTYFLNGDIKKAYAQIDQILKQTKSDQRTDAQALAKLLEPILIYEMQGPEMAHQKLHALKEWLRTNERLYEFERIVITQLEQLFNAATKLHSQILSKLETELEQIRQNLSNLQGLEVIKIWAKAKRTHQPIPEIFTKAQ